MRPYVWQALTGAAKAPSAVERSTEAEEQRRQTIDAEFN